jgi:hypothetical protein
MLIPANAVNLCLLAQLMLIAVVIIVWAVSARFVEVTPIAQGH